MKFLIWAVGLITCAFVTVLLNEVGIGGGLVSAILFAITMYVIRTLCKKYDERYKQYQEENKENKE